MNCLERLVDMEDTSVASSRTIFFLANLIARDDFRRPPSNDRSGGRFFFSVEEGRVNFLKPFFGDDNETSTVILRQHYLSTISLNHYHMG